jgi:hypothetical protein
MNNIEILDNRLCCSSFQINIFLKLLSLTPLKTTELQCKPLNVIPDNAIIRLL